MCVLVMIDFDHVKRVIEAKLEREGFLYDTPARRLIVAKRAGPQPMPGHNVRVISREREREEREQEAA